VRLKASRKKGLVSMVSARALKVAIFASLMVLLHQRGIRPHRIGTSLAFALLRGDHVNRISRTYVVTRAQIVRRRVHRLEGDEFGPGGFDGETSAHFD
jgi:hypothetical protein